MTPTGISAKRLSDICDYPAMTMHKSLEFDGVNWKKESLDSDIIIVDEASMVDQLLLYRLLQALPKKDFVLVLIGDDAQLPSVGPGNVLKELILNGKIPHIHLTEIFRQEEASDIVINAHIINKGKTNLVNKKKDFVFVEIEDENKILDTLIQFVEKLKDRNFQVLSPTYNGVLGVINLNRTLQNVLNSRSSTTKVFRTENCIFKLDDRVMIIKNDYKNEVYNGEQGIISDIDVKNKRIDIDMHTKAISYSFRDSYSMITLDYARTIHKCININTYIPTEKGLMNFLEIMKEYQIEDLNDNFIKKDFKIKVQGMSEEKETSEIFKKNRVKSIKIKTIRGYRLEATNNHPIMTVDKNGNFEWKNSEKLNKGDLVLIKKGFSTAPLTNYPIEYTGKKVHQRKSVIFKDKTINKDVAWLMGLMVGDGYYNDKKHFSIQITIFSEKLVEQVKKVVKENFGFECRVYKKKNKCYSVHITRRTLREVMENLGFEYVLAPNKKIPISIRKSTPEIMASFLSGLYDSDGGINKCGIHFTTVSYNLALGVSNMLLYFGIASSFKNMKKAYRIYIQGEDSRTFFNTIGFREESRLANWKKFKHDSKAYFIPKSNRSFIPNGKILIKSLRKVLKEKYAKNKKTVRYLKEVSGYKLILRLLSNTINGRCNLSTYHLNLLEKYIPDTSLKEWKEIAKFKGFYIDQIESLEQSECDVFDFYIPKGHDFISNGFVSHNSQSQEYDYVIMPFVKEFSVQLQRNLLYTAITRAKKKVYILGHREALYDAIKSNKTSKRNTILSSRISSILLKGEK